MGIAALLVERRRRQFRAVLLRKMLKAGVSKYHPDPTAALAEAEAAL